MLRRRDFPSPLGPVLSLVVLSGLFGISLVFALFPQALADEGEDPTGYSILGWALAIFFGGFALLAARRIVTGRSIALLPDGIHSRGVGGAPFVPWDAIEEVGQYSLAYGYGGESRFLGLRLADPQALQGSRTARTFARLDRRMFRWDIAYSMVGLRFDADELEAAIRHFIAHPEARGKLAADEGALLLKR